MVAWMVLGRQSGGVWDMSPISPRTSRLNPRTGLIRVAPTSRTTRFRPVASFLSVSEENRHSISPRVIPPRVVLARSFGAGAQTSPNSSHIRLPPKAHGAECQKSYPLARAALKYWLPWKGCANWLLLNLLLSHCQANLRL